MKVKLCGFTEKYSLQTAIAQKCDFLGFIFYAKSPRYISAKNAALISEEVPSSIAKVAVVVDFSLEELEKIFSEFSADFVQFHGEESVGFLESFRKKFPQIKIIKAFRIEKKSDLEQAKNFEDVADFFLFDAKVSGEKGGSGKSFDWKILQDFNCSKDWFLSGGINIDNLEEAIKTSGAKMIDISSGIEKTRGTKSPELIEQFMHKVRRLCS